MSSLCSLVLIDSIPLIMSLSVSETSIEIYGLRKRGPIRKVRAGTSKKYTDIKGYI